MARIPLTVSGRGLETGPMVDYSGVSRSPVGQALQGLGADLQVVADRWQAQKDEADAFEANQNFNRFKIAANNDATEVGKTTPVSGAGFHDASVAAFDKRKDEFLATVPERLRPKFESLVQTERDLFSQRQAGLEYDQRNKWYKDGLSEALSNGQAQVYNDPSAFEAAKQEALRAVDASGLPEIEKAEWRKTVEQGIASSLATRELVANPNGLLGALGIAVPAQNAAGIIQSMISVESSGNPNAVSPKGAAGLMQVMPGTGAEISRELGDASFPVNGTEAEQQAYLKRPDVSLRYGTHYMNKMLDRYGGDIDAALIAYNGGPARADAWLKANRDDGVIPKESADYYKKVQAGLNVAGAAAPRPAQPFLKVAAAFVGAHEGRDFEVLSAFIKKSAGINIDPRQTAWCAAYVNAVLGSQGVQGTGKLNARSFLDFGAETNEPQLGDIVVLSRGDPNGWQGHVGFFAGFDEKGNPRVLGGNQGQQVSVVSYDKGKVLGYRRPPSVPNAAAANDRLSQLPGGGPTGGMVVTELDPRFAALPFADRLKFAADAQTQATQQRQQQQTLAKAQYTAHNDAINLGILTGSVTSEDQILFDQVLDDGDKAARLSQFRTQQKDRGLLQADLEALNSGSLSLDPYDSESKKRADKLYTEVAKTVGTEDAGRVAGQIIEQTGVVPQPVMNMVRKGLASQNPTEVAEAAQLAQQIATQDPAALARRDGGSDVQRTADDFSFMVNTLNLDPTEAAQRIIAANDPEKKRQRTALEPAAKEFKKELEESDGLSDIFSFDQVGFNPSQAAGITAEYMAIAESEFYRANGDAELAKNRAAEQMKRLYGVSTLASENGLFGRTETLMKHPPENYWPKTRAATEGGLMGIGADPLGYARRQLFADVKAIDPNIQEGSIQLVTTPQTDADVKAGRMPGYAVMWRDQNGNYQTIPGQQWRPDFTSVNTQIEGESRVLQQEIDAGIESAQQLNTDINAGRDREQSLDTFLAPPATAPRAPSMDAPDISPPTIQDGLDEAQQRLFENGPLNGGSGW